MTPTRVATVSLLLAALGLIAFGATLLVKPSLLGVVGVELARPAAATEIRAIYGGLELGLAAFFVAAAMRGARGCGRRCSRRSRRSAGSCWRG